jgi:hypothetical protein
LERLQSSHLPPASGSGTIATPLTVHRRKAPSWNTSIHSSPLRGSSHHTVHTVHSYGNVLHCCVVFREGKDVRLLSVLKVNSSCILFSKPSFLACIFSPLRAVLTIGLQKVTLLFRNHLPSIILYINGEFLGISGMTTRMHIKSFVVDRRRQFSKASLRDLGLLTILSRTDAFLLASHVFLLAYIRKQMSLSSSKRNWPCFSIASRSIDDRNFPR